ncbi:MAG: BamA/TamA family outer membrane protein [bacterium]|nr:MAG: BamA/TamA family outer membrane protein [bacterium]
MRQYTRSFVRKAIVLLLVLTIALIPAVTTSADGDDGEKDERRDRGEDQHKKLKDRTALDWIIAAPGLLINLPFKILFKGTGTAIGYIDESKIIDRIDDFLTSDDGLRALRPTYSSRNGAGFKVYQKNLVGDGSKLQLSASAGLRARQRYQLSLERLGLFGERVFSDLAIGYRFLPDESFYGIGPNTSKSDESNFAHEQMYAQIGIGTSPFRMLDLVASLRIEQNDIREGRDTRSVSLTELPLASSLPGLERGVRMMGADVSVCFESRATPGGPGGWCRIVLQGAMYNQIEESNYGFYSFKADITQHLHLFYGRVLVLRVAGELVEPVKDRHVPFYYLSEIGRRETVRGFSRGRFRDFDMVLASLEYRYPIWKHHDDQLDAFLFVDAGQVAHDILEDSDWDDVRVGFGGGIRLWDTEGESIKVMLGKSKERYRFYLVLNK